MTKTTKLFRVALPAMLALATAAGVSGRAMAESQSWDWDWGGEQKVVASSGREVVAVDPKLPVGQIQVSFSDRKIYFVTKPGEAISYPVAIPRQQDDWSGLMVISEKKVNPSWTPTPTMIKENPRLPSWVPGGHPYNPLGVRALYLGSSAYRIHGTDAPWTIGMPVSKGCIRMFNKDVVDLYDRVKIGTKVMVSWNSFSGPNAGNRQYAEAKRREAYGNSAPPTPVTPYALSGKSSPSRSAGGPSVSESSQSQFN